MTPGQQIINTAGAMAGLFLVALATMPLTSIVARLRGDTLDAAARLAPVTRGVRAARARFEQLQPWDLPTEVVVTPGYAPTRRARRRHEGAHAWTGLAPGQRRPHELITRHVVRGHETR